RRSVTIVFGREQWQTNAHARSARHWPGDGDAASMCRDDRAGDGQPKPGSSAPPIAGRFDSVKAIEYPSQMLLGNALSGVLDDEYPSPMALFDRDGDPSTRRRVPQRGTRASSSNGGKRLGEIVIAPASSPFTRSLTASRAVSMRIGVAR